MSRGRRIARARTTAGSWSIRSACPCADSRASAATTSRTRARGACRSSSRTGAGRCRSRRLSGDHRRWRWCRRRRSGNWRRRYDRFRRYNLGRCIRCRLLESDVLQSVTTRAATAATRGTGTPSANGGRPLEILLRNRIKDEHDYEQMRKKRGGDTLPPPLSLARYAYRRPVALSYWAGASFGETPMTFTPAPRDTSIA